jgi:cyanate permease
MKSGSAQNYYKYTIEIIVACVVVCCGALWVAPGPLFPLIMKDFGVNSSTVGLTTSIVAMVMAVSSFLSGFLVSRIGLKKTFAIGSFLLAASLLTPLTSDILQVIAIRFAFAMGVAMTFSLASGIVMQWFKQGEVPLMNGINCSASSLGNTLGMSATVYFATALDWKWSLAVYGIFALVMGVLWVVLGKDRHDQAAAVEEGIPRVGMGSIIRQKETIILGICMGGPFLCFNALMSWLPSYYVDNFGMPLSTASFIPGVAPMLGIPVGLIGSYMLTRMRYRKPFIIISGILIGTAAFAAFLVNNLILIYAGIVVFGMCFSIILPVLLTMAMEIPGMNPQRAAIVIAIALAIGNFAGFFGPQLVGVLKDVTGSYLPGLVACSLLSFSLLAGGLFLPETGRKA